MASRPLSTPAGAGRRFSPGVMLPPLALLALWQAACLTGLFPAQVLVPPSEVARSLAAMTASGELQAHIGDSLWRLLIGFAIGAVAGLAFGSLIALSRLAETALSPLFLTLWQVPVIAFVPMMVLFLGIDEPFKIAVVAIAAFFPVALATFDGIRGVPRAWFEVARVYRTRLPDLVRRILLPATVPAVLTGLRVALTRAWVVLIAAELLAADSGIGQMMEMGRQLFRIDVVLAGVVVSGLIGFLLDRGARAIERRATRWRTA
ncbi:ABC transporter permease [Sphingobium jiangsuense]|uniref:Sulfonate transport system permease protein n=1 Tax=Sphingobium jiangsuense TaxID=870476 RepID=A0A7W6BLZ7_9SPHN|nr:ABC transporter permease [Sphingobium jiangsuense]MBB3926062.1 sulfonate transport system permease protein [Sphingobium jiangsuense]GLT00551.1 ABC transporter permease [Sphingobium jiangsuense]